MLSIYRLPKYAVTALLFLFAAATPAPAQDWPGKTVRIVVPFGPGSTPDIVARLVADGLQQKYPTSTFVVENKPGASGNLGTDVVAKATPDGSTIGVSIGGPLAINTLLVRETALRSSQGHRADHPAGHAAKRARGQPGPWGQFCRGARRAVEEKSRQIQFCFDRKRLSVASRDGSNRDQGRRSTRARALYQFAAGRSRR